MELCWGDNNYAGMDEAKYRFGVMKLYYTKLRINCYGVTRKHFLSKTGKGTRGEIRRLSCLPSRQASVEQNHM